MQRVSDERLAERIAFTQETISNMGFRSAKKDRAARIKDLKTEAVGWTYLCSDAELDLRDCRADRAALTLLVKAALKMRRPLREETDASELSHPQVTALSWMNFWRAVDALPAHLRAEAEREDG